MKKIIIYLVIFSAILPYSLLSQKFSGYSITVKNLGENVNSKTDDYAPCLSPDLRTLYFTSFENNKALGKADLFYCSSNNDNWLKYEIAPQPFNTKYNDGAMSFTGDGKIAAFASDRKPGGFGNSDIYLAYFNNGSIDSIVNLGPKVNSKYWDSQPTITSDGDTIYFVSNRPGGMGGYDIWVTYYDKQKKEWSAAVPLGPPINTAKNEFSPCIIQDGGALFFSSDGHPGLGGYDIFMSIQTNGKWGEPQNLGSPINSESDDIFFFAPKKDNMFYFSSNRSGGAGGYDIYSGSPNIFGSGMFRLNVYVLDSATRKPLPCLITLTDDATREALVAFAATNQTDKFTQLLPAGRIFKIEAQVRDFPSKQVILSRSVANKEENVEILFGSMEVAEFDLGKYEVPFFVTGYYRVNTMENLDSLYIYQSGPLKNATYIESFAKGSDRYLQYKAWAEQVDGIFQTVVRTSVEDIFPRFKKLGLPNEYLEIAISGYADPTPVRAGAKYLEPDPVHYIDATGKDMMVYYNDEMNNQLLSGLRAYHAGMLLDNLFRKSSQSMDYLDLMMDGKIKFIYIGAGVTNDGESLAAQRRIRIVMTRRKTN